MITPGSGYGRKFIVKKEKPSYVSSRVHAISVEHPYVSKKPKRPVTPKKVVSHKVSPSSDGLQPPSPISFLFPPIGFFQKPSPNIPSLAESVVPPLAIPSYTPDTSVITEPIGGFVDEIGEGVSSAGRSIFGVIRNIHTLLPLIIIIIVAVLFLRK